MLTILIFEPQKQHAQWMRDTVKDFFLSHRSEIQLTTFSSSQPVLSRLQEDPHQYDILLISASDPICAYKMASIIRKKNLQSSILFFAADYKPLLNTLAYRPSAFFALPIDPKRLQAALLRAQEEQSRDAGYFYISNKNGFIRVPYDDIEYFQSDQHNVLMFVKGKTEGFQFHAKLDSISSYLPSGLFLRCHQSYCINTRHIRAVDKNKKCIELSSEANIPISKRNYVNVIAACNKLMTKTTF